MDTETIKAPNTFLIIAAILVVVAIATWVVPAGSFERREIENREVVVPGTFKLEDAQPQGIGAILMAPIRGFTGSALIIGFVLLVGGAFGVLQKTGAIDGGIASLVRLNDKSKWVRTAIIPIVMMLFSLCGAVFGMSEEVIPFVLVFVPLALSLGYDSIVGVAMPFVGAGAGFAGAYLNPFTLGVAQGIADLPPSSGFRYRLICWCVITAVSILFVMRYARRVHRAPEKSPVYDLDQNKRHDMHMDNTKQTEFTAAHRFVLIVFACAMVVLLIGVTQYGWYIEEIAGLFVGTGILCGVVGKLSRDDIVSGIIEGARALLSTALIIALARGILVIAERGRIIDTVLNVLSSLIDRLPGPICAQIMFLVQTVLNFFVPSGSGQAALTMPVMAPLGDLVGVSRQTAVLAFQFGDGFSNLIIPTSAVCMGVLALAGIPWEKWAKWMLPLQLILVLVGMVLLIPPFFIGW